MKRIIEMYIPEKKFHKADSLLTRISKVGENIDFFYTPVGYYDTQPTKECYIEQVSVYHSILRNETDEVYHYIETEKEKFLVIEVERNRTLHNNFTFCDRTPYHKTYLSTFMNLLEWFYVFRVDNINHAFKIMREEIRHNKMKCNLKGNSDVLELMTKYTQYIDTDTFDKINHFDIAVDDNSKLSYFTPERFGRFSCIPMTQCSDYIESGIRQKYAFMGKPGKVFKKICYKNTPDSIISEFTNKFIAQFNIDSKLVLENSEKIPAVYKGDNYFNTKGNLGSSCMRDMDSEVFDIYVKNGVKILTLWKQEKVAGRALLWPNVEFSFSDKPLNFLDRIYVNDDKDTQLFKNWCDNNNTVYKTYQSYEELTSFTYQGEEYDEYISIYLEYKSFEQVPYLDTMRYLDINEGMLTNEESSSYIELDRTDGVLNATYCSHCEEYCDSEDSFVAANGEEICGYCYGNHYATCEDCGEIYNIDDIYFINDESICQDCIDKNHTLCDYCNEYIHNDDIIEVDDKKCCQYCASENFSYCEHCDEYHESGEMSEEESGICQDCFNAFYAKCEKCDEYETDTIEVDGTVFCRTCFRVEYFYCHSCDKIEKKENIIQYGDKSFCSNDCINRYKEVKGKEILNKAELLKTEYGQKIETLVREVDEFSLVGLKKLIEYNNNPGNNNHSLKCLSYCGQGKLNPNCPFKDIGCITFLASFLPGVSSNKKDLDLLYRALWFIIEEELGKKEQIKITTSYGELTNDITDCTTDGV